MEVLHEWKLAKYGRQISAPNNQWQMSGGTQTYYLRILASRMCVISSETEVQESFSLFGSALWLTCFQRGDGLLIIHKIKRANRKFRLRFEATEGRSSLDICNEVAAVLKQYIRVMKLSKDSMVPEGQLQFSVQEESNSLNGVVSQSVLTKAIFGPKDSLPIAYSSTNYPTGDELDSLVRLCLIDPNFPAFVEEIETAVQTIIK